MKMEEKQAEPRKEEEKKEGAAKKEAEKAASKPAKPTEDSKGNLAIILIRGKIGLNHELKDTLQMLKIPKKNSCVIIPDTPSFRGMVKKVHKVITWGEVDDSTIKKLKEKREIMTKNKKGEEIPQPFYRLSPPKGGFERKGTKIPFKIGGALGYRGSKINDLIKRML
jgi:large subunit ribosomal protein L30